MYDGWKIGPVLVYGNERRHVEGDVEGADAQSLDVAPEQRPDRPAEILVLRTPAYHDELLLLDRDEAGQGPDVPFGRDAEAQRVVDAVQVVEVVGATFDSVGRGGPAEALDPGIVRAAGDGDLGVSVDDGAAGPPEAIPHEERVAGLRVGFEGLVAPLQAHRDVVGDLLGGEVERVVVVEDDDAVEAVVLGDVRGGDRVLAPHPPEDVRGGAVLGVAERIADRGLYLA